MNELRARVRVVDRDPELAASIAAILRDDGFETSTCHADERACDLVVVGLPAQPDVSRRLDPQAPIVLMRSTRLPLGVVEEWILDRPGFAILEKPVSPSALLHVVRTLLDAAGNARSEPKDPGDR